MKVPDDVVTGAGVGFGVSRGKVGGGVLHTSTQSAGASVGEGVDCFTGDNEGFSVVSDGSGDGPGDGPLDGEGVGLVEGSGVTG